MADDLTGRIKEGNLSRRDFLKLTGLGALTIGLGGLTSGCAYKIGSIHTIKNPAEYNHPVSTSELKEEDLKNYFLLIDEEGKGFLLDVKGDAYEFVPSKERGSVYSKTHKLIKIRDPKNIEKILRTYEKVRFDGDFQLTGEGIVESCDNKEGYKIKLIALHGSEIDKYLKIEESEDDPSVYEVSLRDIPKQHQNWQNIYIEIFGGGQQGDNAIYPGGIGGGATGNASGSGGDGVGTSGGGGGGGRR